MDWLLALALENLLEPISGAGASLLNGGTVPSPVSLFPKFTSMNCGSGGVMVGGACCH